MHLDNLSKNEIQFKLPFGFILNMPALLFCSFIFFVTTSYFSIGYYHLDEHFQILEFAGSKLNLISIIDLPWEYKEQMRPAIQPLSVVVIYKSSSLFVTPNPFVIAFLLRLISALFTFSILTLFYKKFESEFQDNYLKKTFFFLSFFLWFIIFNGVRFSSENLSGSFFALGFILYDSNSAKKNILIGLLLGLALITRFQVAFLIFGFLSWILIIQKSKKNTVFLVLGISISIVLGFFIDFWFYGKWVFTSYNYLEQNIFQNKAAQYGTSPWWFYFSEILKYTLPPFSLIYLVCLGAVLRYLPKDILTWTILPFIIIHLLIGHKELRFLFPLLLFLPLITSRGILLVRTKINFNFINPKLVKIVTKLFFVSNFLCLIFIAFKPAEKLVSIYKFIYNTYPNSTKLFYTGNNPYLGLNNNYFYKRESLTFIEVNSIAELNIPNSTKVLFVTKNKTEIAELQKSNKIVYSSYPVWLKFSNFNHWMERSNPYYIFEIKGYK